MRRILRSSALLLAVSLCLCALAGCADAAHYASVENRALEYYQDKYQVKDVRIIDSYKAGNAGLFGYIDVKDRAYELSDGNSIYWNETTGKYSDNAQAEEILISFNKEVLDPLLADFSAPIKVKPARLNRTDMDSYDECVFSAYFDGDIRSFLRQERPHLSGLEIALESEKREACEQEASLFFSALRPYVTGWCNVTIVNEGLDELIGDDWYLSNSSLNVTAEAYMDFSEGIRWYRQTYIEVTDGIYMTSAQLDFSFEDGDVTFVEAGSCAELQSMLDKGYYSMPIDAPENKNGGYQVHDQRHEKRVVLDDLSAPFYRIKLSNRVVDALDKDGRMSVYVLDRRESGAPLMSYYGMVGRGAYSVYRVCDIGAAEGEYDSIEPDMLYYFGTHQLIPYEGE